MRYNSKYIILDHICAVPVVFSDVIGHDDMARGFKVMGADFCYLEDEKYVCYGKSTSLGIESDPERDARILNKYLGIVGEDS